MLRFATCQYIDEGRHIILKGASGNGKTYIACALGNAACRKFKSVRYIRMPELLDELSVAKANGEFAKVVKPSFSSISSNIQNNSEPSPVSVGKFTRLCPEDEQRYLRSAA